MSSKRRIRHLALHIGISPANALHILERAGFPYNSSDDQIARHDVNAISRLLERGAKSIPQNPRSVLRGGARSSREISPAEDTSGQRAQLATKRKKRVHLRQAKSRRIARLSHEEVMAIRQRMRETLIARQHAFGAVEPLFPDMLVMAVERQNTSGGGVDKYDSIPLVGASLTFGLAMGHPFENGNKRTALVTLLVFLERNKTLLTGTVEDELYQLITTLVKHELPLPTGVARNADSEVMALADWIQDHSRQLELGDHMMRFSELRQTLESLGCVFGSPDKNFIKIRAGNRSVRTGYPRPNFEVQVREVKRIRKVLRLDEIHGLDSTGFYYLHETVDKFVNQYRNLMRRLADI